ncbi:HAD family hydrolase [Vreelandella zhaodongensis]|uniref:HAD family phosphatase n=1 Tax=Vreelandella zhaodongensis TaxID=1176240 RepID=A0ABX2SUW0_VREZH|nr:HAD family phosphatase [Halomonas zhaodongensis]NYS44981.1 HAD family phosphatase [Halomonas zhaodongensis]
MGKRIFSAVCFDMDGVLVQSRDVIEKSWAYVASAYDVKLTNTDIQKHIHGRPGDYTLNALFGEFPEHLRTVIKQRVDTFEETSPCSLVPGVSTLLKKLQRSQVPIALVTSSWTARIDFILRLHKLEGVFKTIISREDVTNGKPNPDCYLKAACQLGIEPDNCLVFEDSQSGVKAAVQSGASCIAIGDDPYLKQCGAIELHEDFCTLHPRLSSLSGHHVESCSDNAHIVFHPSSDPL